MSKPPGRWEDECKCGHPRGSHLYFQGCCGADGCDCWNFHRAQTDEEIRARLAKEDFGDR